jgi:methyl-accepting chemotaxis protein
MKIKYKLSIFVIAVLTLSIAATALLLENQAAGIVRDLSVENISRFASQQASLWQGKLNNFLAKGEAVAAIMADYEQIPIEDRRERFNGILAGIVRSDPNIQQIYSIWKPGVLDDKDSLYGQYAMAYTNENDTIASRNSSDISEAMQYMAGPNAYQRLVGNPFTRVINGKECFFFRIRIPVISDDDGQVKAMVGLVVSIDLIQNEMETIMKTEKGISAIALYTGNGFIAGSFDPKRVGKTLDMADAGLYMEDTDEAMQAVLGGKEFRAARYSPYLKANLLISLFPFAMGDAGEHWSIMLGVNEAHVLAEIRETFHFTLFIMAIIVPLAAGLIFSTIWRLTKPMIKVGLTLKDISEGEGDLTRKVLVNSKDEVGDLARYFNKTLEKIASLINVIKNESISLAGIGDGLAANTAETAAAVNEITASLESMKERMQSQSTGVNETNAAMQKVVGNIEKLNGLVEEEAGRMSQSGAAIEEMIANIQSVTKTLTQNSDSVKVLSSAAELGRNSLAEVSADIQEIAKESEGLLAINAVMENIAGQTNLLSMNAAIEAAHAGEAGKGFAVVADEIRKLAENSAAQSKTISQVLQRITACIAKITNGSETVLHKFEAIENGVATVKVQSQNIQDAMEEQSVGSKQILENLSALENISGQVKDRKSVV